MTAEQAAMMLQLQQVGMTMDDLREYLDTHLYDTYAIERFNMAAAEYAALQEEYSRTYSPPTWRDQDNSTTEWAWGISDFPWDY